MKKLTDVLLKIFSYSIIACLFAGGISLIGYIVALIIGGESATAMCLWVFKSYLPWVIKATSIVTAIGLLGMYLSKQKALTVKKDK